MYIYWTYRPKVIGWRYSVENNTSLNWVYTPAFFLDWMYWDYKEAWLTRVEDTIIPEENYTWEIVPGIKKLTRFISWYYNEKYIQSFVF